jgi:S-DNA-T family DNA segregation ATPase FtsK/SpoIIIE
LDLLITTVAQDGPHGSHGHDGPPDPDGLTGPDGTVRQDILLRASARTPVREVAAHLMRMRAQAEHGSARVELPEHSGHLGHRGQPDHPAWKEWTEWREGPFEEAVPLYLDDVRLDPGVPLSSSGIRDGCTVGLGAPVPPSATARGYGPSRAQMPRGPVYSPAVELHVVGGPDAGRVHVLQQGTHDIGPAPDSSVPLTGREVPPAGLRVTVRPDGSALVRLPPTGDARLSLPEPPPHRGRADVPDTPQAPDDAEAPHVSHGAAEVPTGWVPWPLDSELAVGEYLLRLVERTGADAAVMPSEDGAGLDYNRPPRIIPPLTGERFRLPGPPTPPTRRPIPLIVVLSPMFLGLGMVFFFKSYFYLLFALFSPVMVAANTISSRRSGRKEYLEQVTKYRTRRASLEEDVRRKVDDEQRLRSTGAPDPATTGLIAVGPGHRLWERRRSDPDHLLLRIGTARQPSMLELDDAAREDNHRSVHWNIPDMPVSVDTAGCGVVGIAGEPEPARALARWLTAQAAALHTPRDLRIIVLTDQRSAASWEWVRWLPHSRGDLSGAGSASVTLLGNDPETIANRVSELVSQLHSRTRAAEATMSQALLNEPDLLVVLDGARRLRDVPGVVQILKTGPAVRVFLLCVDQEERLLPEECAAVVRYDKHRLALRRTGHPDVTDIRPDLVGPVWCERLARGLAPIRDVTPDAAGGLPDSVGLLDTLQLAAATATGEELVGPIMARWQQRPASTAVRLGVGYDGPVEFDLVRDGPHALVAGTTGSGKSELLQTFVASLAAANRPDELTFVLVDYKGGSAFKDCVRLPHALGMVTDLDSHLVERALESLSAELLRREHLLAAVGAKDHTEYRAARRREPALAPLPRLVLVIDEFATLAREIPDFVPGLVGIAQRGRSLGLHLVLATQRPAGVVTADIRANTNLRIALRVTDTAESQDVIDTSDAVSISASTPGRALARLGHRSALPFQTAYAGTPRLAQTPGHPAAQAAEEPPVWTAALPWQRLGRPAAPASHAGPADDQAEDDAPTELGALVEAVRTAAEQSGWVPQPSPWLPPLPPQVVLDDLLRAMPAPAGRPGQDLAPVPWALEDIPGAQAQLPTLLDFAVFGHLFVLGVPRSGRSQTLRVMAGALARVHSAADVHLYGIDFAGGALSALGTLPHCGAVVPRGDVERLERLMARLGLELTQRQAMLSATSAGSLTELRMAATEGHCPAHILVLIDGWDPLSALVSDHDDGRLMEELTRLLREGAAAGIHVVATSERGLLGGRIAALCDDRLMLRMNDRADYTAMGVDASKLPSTIPPGRGWRSGDGIELQVALLAPGASGQEQTEALRRIGAAAEQRDQGVPAEQRPFQIGTLPSRIGFAEAYEQVPEELARQPRWGLLGLGGDDVSPFGIDFSATPTFMVAGPPGSGRSTALASLAVSMLAGGTSLVVLTPRESPLRRLGRHPEAAVLTSADPSAAELNAALEALSGPGVILVDDADLLAMMPAADQVLRTVAASGRDRGLGLALAATPETLTSALSGWLGEARRHRKGVLLSPQNLLEGDLLGVRLPHSALRRGARRPGHALTTHPRTGELVTVLIPETELR